MLDLRNDCFRMIDNEFELIENFDHSTLQIRINKLKAKRKSLPDIPYINGIIKNNIQLLISRIKWDLDPKSSGKQWTILNIDR